MHAAVAGVVAALAGLAAFVWLFGSGAVFGQEADAWETTKVVVRARVLGDDLVRLSEPPERWVATGEGRAEYLAMLEGRGLKLVDVAGGGMMFRRSDGRGCGGSQEQFTADLTVFRAPRC